MKIEIMKKTIIILTMGLIVIRVNAQQYDSLFGNEDTSMIRQKNLSLKKMPDRRQRIRSLILPGALLTYGLISLGSDGLKDLDEEVKEEVWSEHPHRITNADNFLQYAPAISVYALNAAGIHGKNNLRDRTMILLLSNLFSNATVFSLKKITHQLRPDGSSYTSFPSGHTAEAFASAEFLRQEYRDVSPWYGTGGYIIAGTVGYLRMYNNKHWLSDVIAGAGIGIGSVKLAYWIYPSIKKIFFKDRASKTALVPVYQNNSFGFALVHNF
jgi:PAP2 superfamily